MVIEQKNEWTEMATEPSVEQPIITLTKSRTFRLNSICMKKFNLYNAERVGVMFNMTLTKLRVGFIFYEDKTQGNLSLFLKDKSGAMFSAQGILKQLGMKLEDFEKLPTRKFVPYKEKVGDKELLVIDILKREGEQKTK